MSSRPADIATADFRVLFESSPGLHLVLQPDAPRYSIVAVSNDYARATMIRREEVVGRGLFEVFPDNPGDPTASGVRSLGESLARVLASRAPDTLGLYRYDIRRRADPPGPFEERYWKAVNTPVLDADGNLSFIIHSVEDVTKSELLQRATVEQAPPPETPPRAQEDAGETGRHRMRTQLQTFVRWAPISISMFDRHMDYLAYSDLWLRDYGGGKTDLIGCNHYQICPDLPDWWKDVHSRAQAGATLNKQGELWVQADGTKRWVSWSALPWFDDDGAIGGILIATTDVTEYKRAEEALRDRVEWLSGFLENSETISWLKDEQGRHVYLSRSYEERLGVRLADWQGKTDLEVWPLDVAAQFRANDQAVLAADQPLEVEEFSLSANGTKTWWLSHKFIFHDRDGKRYVGGLAVDITDRKRAEVALRESEQRYATLFEKSPIAKALTKLPSGEILAVNDAFVRLFECTREDLSGPSRVGRGLIDADSQARASAAFAARGSLRDFECVRTTKSGARRFISLHVDRVSIGGVPHVLTSFWDITERKQAAENARLYEQAKELDTLKSQFFAGVSHELRTPLALILGPAQRLLHAQQTSEDARHDLAVIVRNAHILERHVDDLLSAARLDAGRLKPEYAQVDLAPLARLLASHFEVLAQEQRIDYQLRTPETLVAQVDADMLGRILLNLLSNAFKYTPAQGQVRLTLRQPQGEQVVFEVADSGPGIPVEQRELVFERFHRIAATAAQRFGGTGLGLAIARELTNLLKGTISLGEAPEGGALFVLRLPSLAPQGTVVRALATSLQPPGYAAARQLVEELRSEQATAPLPGQPAGPLALIVEDNLEMNRFLAESLADRYRIAAAYDGKEGLNKALELHPDIIIADLMMPVMSGEHLVQAVRAHRELDNVPIILVTAKMDHDLRVWLLRQGAQDYVTKPFAMEELRARIDNLTTKKRAEEALQLSEAKLAGMVSIAADAIISLDHNQRITLFNEGAEKIFGYSKAEVLGSMLDILLPERFRILHRHNVERFLNGQQTARRMGERGPHICGLRKNGEEFPADAAISKLEVGGERVLTVVLRDITEQRRTEDQQRFLAEVGVILASTLDYEETLTRIAEQAVLQLADFCLLEVVEESSAVSRLIARGDARRAVAVESLRRVHIEHGRPRLGSSVYETKQALLLPDITPESLRSLAPGDEQLEALCALGPCSLMALPLLAHGRLLGCMVIISTTASRRYAPWELPLAEELAQRAALAVQNARLYRAAQRAVTARDEVLGIVAHDLRNPLNGILLQSQLLPAGKPESLRRSADIIQRSVRRMARLIQDLLDVARMEAGYLAVEPGCVPSGPVVCDAVESQKSMVAAVGLELRLALPQELPDVWVDRDRLLQVFENLIGNAVKFTDPGGTITAGATPAEGAVLFWVADTGTGIAADSIARMFDRFWQGKRADRRGVGLGLHIAKGIIEAHGGRIWVKSAPGNGTTFFFTVPIAAHPGAPARAVAAPPPARSPHRGVRILTVDDEPEPLAALAKLLSSEGFIVETAGGGLEALSRLECTVPDLLLADVQMPDLDGIALAAQVRKQRPRMPIILTTWLDEAEQALKSGLAQEHIHYVPKPIEFSELLDVIDRALAAAAAQ